MKKFSGPGIVGLMLDRPEHAKHYSALADLCLQSEGSLSKKFRETIASLVSADNSCSFCEESHACVASLLPDDDSSNDPIPRKERRLENIALAVSNNDILEIEELKEKALKDGASEEEIHDVVFIASLFSFFNRYVNAMNPEPSQGKEAYMGPASMLVQSGYCGVLKMILGETGD
jgi:alkylhydroperoxidase family enzyme